MGELSSKTVLVYDYGANVELARRLSRDFGRVLYFKPWKDSCPSILNRSVGIGYDEIERVRDVNDVLDEIDLAVFPDINDGDLQLEWERRGIRIWGSRKAERYEYNRVLFKQALKQVGLSVGKFKVCNGMTELRRYLSKTENKWIKQNFRGDGETWNHINYELSQPKLSAMDYYYGPLAEDVQFVVDDQIDSVIEVAYDGYMVTSPEGKPQFPALGLLGYEDKSQAHIVAVTPYDEMDESVRDVNDRFAPLLAKENARTQWGTEIKKTENDYFFLDATPRAPCPPGEVEMEIVTNLGEIFYHGAAGELVEMNTEAKFGSEIMLYSSWGETNHQPVQIPSKVRPFVKLLNCYRKDGIDWVIPPHIANPVHGSRSQIGAVIGFGNTIEESNDMAISICKEIKGFETDPQIASLAECLKRINLGEEEGIEFADTVPEPESVMNGD